MTRKRLRLYIVGLGMLCVAAATALVLTVFEENIVFFYSPSDVQEKGVPAGRIVRVGGLVEEDSVQQRSDGGVNFVVTDLANSLTVSYAGILPDLFREGQGIVAKGTLSADGVFLADEVLAKHDENYMPPEVAEALKKSGEWRDETGAAPAEGQAQ
jgi:cytochrome c-type biogenesis protein CcmE